MTAGSQLIDRIRTRAEQIRLGQKSDIVTGLVVQGGGMRGLYSLAALEALEESGLTGGFDHIFGSSSGTFNGTCFAVGLTREGVAAYIDHVASKQFINYLRLGKIMDVDYLVDEVVGKKLPLLLEGARSFPVTLHAVLTDLETRVAKVVTNREYEVDWRTVLRASAAIPPLYKHPVAVNGRLCMDGGLVEPLPLMRAVEAGCTDIVVILTREASYRARTPLILDLLERPFLRRYPKEIRHQIAADRQLFNSSMELAEFPQRARDGVRLLAIHPSDPRRLVTQSTIKRDKLLACAQMAREDARRALQQSETSRPVSKSCS